MSDRIVRFSEASWQEVEALPEPLRWTVQRAIFHLLDEPVPTLADPFPQDDPLPGGYELHLPADHVTIWYTVTPHHGQEVIGIQLVRPGTYQRAGRDAPPPSRLITIAEVNESPPGTPVMSVSVL